MAAEAAQVLVGSVEPALARRFCHCDSQIRLDEWKILGESRQYYVGKLNQRQIPEMQGCRAESRILRSLSGIGAPLMHML